jgi:hypothetical protein
VLPVVPNEQTERKLDPDPRVLLHQWRAGAGVAEYHHLTGQLHADLSRGCGMIDLGEHGQTTTFDPVETCRSVSPYPDELTTVRVTSAP